MNYIFLLVTILSATAHNVYADGPRTLVFISSRPFTVSFVLECFLIRVRAIGRTGSESLTVSAKGAVRVDFRLVCSDEFLF